MANVSAGTVTVTVQGKDAGLSALIKRLEQQMQAGIKTANTYSQSLASISSSSANISRNLASLSSSNKSAVDSFKDARKAVDDYIKSLNRVPTKIPTPAPGPANQPAAANVGNVNAAIAGFAKLAGTVYIAQQAIQALSVPIELANNAEKIDTTFRALSVTTAEYEKNLALAKNQQKLFGGSLAENQENLSGFLYTARLAKVSVEELANVARKLAIIDQFGSPIIVM